MFMRFLPEPEIETAALRLLAEYGKKFGAIADPPVPITEIVDSHLNLSLGLGDLAQTLGVTGVLGATKVSERKVLIDQSLDPEVFPRMEGRYHFTLAHEVGHWELHRHLVLGNPGQTSLVGAESRPQILCRKASAKEPIEYQADLFSGFLLMPRELVMKRWGMRFGKMEPYFAGSEIASLSAKWGLGEEDRPTVSIARILAQDFKVSGEAMQIRLMKLGLVRAEAETPDLFTTRKLV